MTKKVINTSNKTVMFPKWEICFLPNEIKELDSDIVEELLVNQFMKEVVSKPVEQTVSTVSEKTKGRRRR